MQKSIRQPIFCFHTLDTIQAQGDGATVTVRQAYSRVQRMEGKLRKVETSVTQDETWVRTAQGWKRRLVENPREMEWFVDGQRVEPRQSPAANTTDQAP